jgi:hypothetical protein
LPRPGTRLSAALSLSLLLAACGGGGGGGSTPSAEGHSLSGTVVGAAGVTVTLSGKASAATTTDAAGDYQFRDLADGTYTVTPSRTGYTFNPASIEVSLSGADESGVDFSGSATATTTTVPGHSVSGTVVGAAGVTVTLSGKASATTTTDAAGNYQFRDLADGSYTVTPSLTGYTFDPASAVVSLSGADESGVDFSASATATTPTITDPQDVAVQEGAEATFTVTASGSPAPSIAWERSLDGSSWVAISGATASTYRLVVALADDGALFRAKATSNGRTATSAAAELTVTAAPPRIVTPPASLTVVAGQQGCLWVKATGAAPLHFQWRHDGVDERVDSPALCPPIATPGDAGSYTVTVSNAAGTVTSPPATLRVDAARAQSVLLIGGQDPASGAAFARVERYDLATSAWSTLAPLTTPRTRHAAVRLLDGRLLVTGGWNRPSEFRSAELYDPRTGVWTQARYMEFDRSSHTATVLADGRVLVVGGNNVAQHAEIYDPVQDTWSRTGTMAVPNRASHTATLLRDGRVLVVGGFSSAAAALRSVAEVYDPATNGWSPVEVITQRRDASHTATLLADGRVLIAGGTDRDASGATVFLDSVELYDPSTGSRTDAARLAGKRYGHGAGAFPNGNVLVAGGWVERSGTSRTAELFSGRGWTAASDLSQYRGYSTAALLADGRVVVACGDYQTWTSVDLYDSSGARTAGAVNPSSAPISAQAVVLLNQ